MNETLKTITERYSCRSFTDKSISDDDLRAIADAGVKAPSARNNQGWHISIVTNKVLLSEIETEGLRTISELPDKTVYERIMERSGKLFYNAAAVAFIAVKDSDTNAYANVDLGIVAQNISLAATSLGIDNCHCGFIRFCFSVGKTIEFNTNLGFPEGFKCYYGVLLGYGNGQGTPHIPDMNKVSFIK